MTELITNVERTPVLGEIWMDGEGTLMCSAGGDKWLVFGLGEVIEDTHPLMVQPCVLVFDLAGERHVDRLCYPDGNAFGVPKGRQN